MFEVHHLGEGPTFTNILLRYTKGNAMVGICPVTVTWQLHKTVSRDLRCFGISNHKGRIIASFPSTPRVFFDLALSAMPVPCHNTVATWICHRVASNGTSGMHWRHIKKRKYKLAGFENLSHTEIRKGLKRGCQTLWIFCFSFFFSIWNSCGWPLWFLHLLSSSSEFLNIKLWGVWCQQAAHVHSRGSLKIRIHSNIWTYS